MSPSLLQARQNSIILPEDLLDNLKEAHQVLLRTKSSEDGVIFQSLVIQVKRIAGITGENSWNRTIDFLDNYKPDWRGYTISYVWQEVA